MPPTTSPIAAAVRAEVARAGLTGRQLGRELGWSPARTERRLNGGVQLRANELAQIAEHLNVPLDRFLKPLPAGARDDRVGQAL